jgi:hypothetical protein
VTRRAALLVALLLGAAACTPGSREAEPFEGRWQSEGHGSFMVIDGGNVDVYEHTAVSCVKVQEGAARGISDVLSFEGDRLVLDDDGRVVRFDRIEFLPERCIEQFFTDDPAATLAVLDATLRELYLPGVDAAWGERLAAVRLPADPTPEQVHEAVVALLEPLGDPEVRLLADGLADPVWVAAEPGRRVREALPAAVEGAEAGLLVGDVGGVGYLAITSLDALGSRQETVLGVALDRALAEAGDTLVLDLRMASGGLDRVARLVASRFVPTMRSVGARLVEVDGALTAAGEVLVTPVAGGAYDGRIVVLIGPGTSGSGEVLAAALMSVPGAIVAGQPTAGRPGQPLVRVLPTGWSIGVPRLALRTADGEVIGPDGLQPAVPLSGGPAEQLGDAARLAAG